MEQCGPVAWIFDRIEKLGGAISARELEELGAAGTS